MPQIALKEAETMLAKLIGMAAAGEEVIITKHAMKLLLDTHAFLWFIGGSPNLSTRRGSSSKTSAMNG